MVKISEDELVFLTGANDPARARDLLWTERMKLMVVTTGPAGSVYITSDFLGAVPSFKVKSVDATGAGDAFTAGLLAGLLKQRKAMRNESMLKDVVRFANAVGALTTTARGAIPSLPTRQQVEEFLETGSAVPKS